MKSFSIIRKGFDFVLPLAACSFFGVLVAQEPRREQDKNAAPTPRATNQRPGDKDQPERGRNTAPANPAREGERGTRPEGGRPEAGPDAKNRFLNELNLSKDERAKVESILAAREEKMREVQQSTMKAIRDTIGEEKFQTFMKNSANPNKRAGPANPPREGDRGARPEAGKPEAGRPEGERKAGPAILLVKVISAQKQESQMLADPKANAKQAPLILPVKGISAQKQESQKVIAKLILPVKGISAQKQESQKAIAKLILPVKGISAQKQESQKAIAKLILPVKGIAGGLVLALKPESVCLMI